MESKRLHKFVIFKLLQGESLLVPFMGGQDSLGNPGSVLLLLLLQEKHTSINAFQSPAFIRRLTAVVTQPSEVMFTAMATAPCITLGKPQFAAFSESFQNLFVQQGGTYYPKRAWSTSTQSKEERSEFLVVCGIR